MSSAADPNNVIEIKLLWSFEFELDIATTEFILKWKEILGWAFCRKETEENHVTNH